MLKRNLAILVLAAAVLGGGAFAWAQTSDGSSTPPTVAASTAATQQAPTQQGAGRRAGQQAGANANAILRRVIHGDLLVRTKTGFQTVTYDRGTEDGVSGSTLTITRPDNHKVTVNLTATTKYRGVQNASELQAGKQTLIVSNDGNALSVAQRPDTTNGPGTTTTTAPAGQ
ncbi:MAG: hypothetical protein JO075_07825 [Acidimicrobiia bacterium]|nr:hypothetical protein [Acidimicrobiia bacterium]